jgi:hypothetical protein
MHKEYPCQYWGLQVGLVACKHVDEYLEYEVTDDCTQDAYSRIHKLRGSVDLFVKGSFASVNDCLYPKLFRLLFLAH